MNQVTAQSNKHYNWSILPDLYLGVSLILIDKILRHSMLDNCSGSEIMRECEFRSYHPNYEMIIPCIHNFKHGIELYIKGLRVIDDSKYYTSHDLKFLFEQLIDHTINTKNHKITAQLYKETWPIISKYYYGRYIPGKERCNFADKQNIAERYPEYEGREKQKGKSKKKSGIYKIPDTYKWVTGNVLTQIKQDIHIIEEKFSQAQRHIEPSKIFIYGRLSKKSLEALKQEYGLG